MVDSANELTRQSGRIIAKTFRILLKVTDLYMMNKTTIREAIRFCIVGVLATIVHYGLYLLLKPTINVSVAYTIGYAVSFIGNFILTNIYTFKTKATAKKGVGFVVCHVINYLLHIGLLNLFIWIGISSSLAPIPVYCIVVPINFLLVRKVIKTNPKKL